MSKRLYLVVEANQDENVVFEGTADEVSQFVKVHPTQVRRASRFGSLVRSRFRIEPKYGDQEPSLRARVNRLYWLYNPDDRTTTLGTAYEIAERLGTTVSAVRQAQYSGYRLKRKYDVCGQWE